MKAAQGNVKSSTQKFTEIRDIVDTIVLLEGGRAALIIEVQAANFALLSKQEQDAKIYAYAALLNSLSFSIQILIRNKRIDISSYIKLLEVEMQRAGNPTLATYIELYRNFVRELVKVNTVLDKQFYIVIPYSYLERGAGAAASSIKGPHNDELSSARQILHTKAEAMHAQIARIGLRGKTLGKEELVRLFYDIYNQELPADQIEIDVASPVVKSKPFV